MSDSEETLLEFPVDFPIKVMGEDSPEFHASVRDIIEKHAGPLPDDKITTALSRNERFVSITVTINAQSREQLDNIYRELTAHNDVKMAL